MVIRCVDHGICRRCPIPGVDRHFVASQFRTPEKLFAARATSQYQIQRQALWVSLWCSERLHRWFSVLCVLSGAAGASEGTEHTPPAALRISKQRWWSRLLNLTWNVVWCVLFYFHLYLKGIVDCKRHKRNVVICCYIRWQKVLNNYLTLFYCGGFI